MHIDNQDKYRAALRETPSLKQAAKPALKAGRATIALSSLLVVIKTIAFIFSGSLAVLSSLFDSALDTLVSAMNYAALKYAIKPADEDHRSGHGKIEGLAALLQSLIIGAAALYLVYEALMRLINAQALEAQMLAIIIMIASMFIGLYIVHVQNKALKKSQSLILEADQAHYTSDLVIHAGVIVALMINAMGGPLWVDTLIAMAIALWLLKTAREIASKGLDMVLDRELGEESRLKILDIINAHDLVLGVHDLRATQSGLKEHIIFDIEADPALSLHDAHAITKDLEIELLKHFPQAEIMIHVDPHGDIEDSRHKVAEIHF
ncbi:MAG: cation diffusion facilitator family transporter [Micavibrio sp.]|nr:cation diffusion facilitator family transporter [Micavibrio sp.]